MLHILTFADLTSILAFSHQHAAELHKQSNQSHLPAHSARFGGGTIGNSKSFDPRSKKWYEDNRLGMFSFLKRP